MRDHPDFELERFNDMLLTIFHPMNDSFLNDHNGAVITNYWANWDLSAMCSVLAIGGLTDRVDLVERAVQYFETGAGNGSIEHAVPFLHHDEYGALGQWQESGRDQGHTTLGIGLMGAFCEMAWNLGHDCYGYDDNRFLKGAEYVAKYNLGFEVPFTEYWWQSGPATTAPHAGWSSHTQPSDVARGIARPVWELVAGHYSGRRGLEPHWVQQMVAQVRPEGGGGDYGDASGGYDQLGFGTLADYRPRLQPPVANAGPPVVTKHPGSVTSALGSVVVLSAAASGDPTPLVRWQRQKPRSAVWTDVAGGRGSKPALRVRVRASRDGSRYRAVFTNSAGRAESNAATLRVLASAPVIRRQPTAAIVQAGDRVVFQASATGFPTPTASWQRRAKGSRTWVAVPNSRRSTLSLALSPEVRRSRFRAVFTNESGTAVSRGVRARARQRG